MKIKAKLTIYCFLILGSCLSARAANAITQIYRSVGPNATSPLAVGAGNNLAISGSTATFASAPGDPIGVGDAIQYDSDGNGSIDAIAFIHGRTSAKVYTIRTATGGEPTPVPDDQNWSIFRSYTSLFNAEQGYENDSIDDAVEEFETFTPVQGGKDLTNTTGSDEQWNIACYAGQGGIADQTRAVINGWTTDSDNFIKLYTPYLLSEVGTTQRHSGKWDTTKYRLEVTVNGYCLEVHESYVRLIGLQVSPTYTSGYAEGIGFPTGFGSTAYLLVDKCIIRGGAGANGSGIYSANSIIHVQNTLIYDFAVPGAYAIYTSSVFSPSFQNLTIVNCANGIRGGDANNAIKNCGFSGVTTPYPGTSTRTTCSEITPTFADADNDDFHLASGDTTWKNQGTNLSANFTEDIDGEGRPGTWDIGTDEYTENGAFTLSAWVRPTGTSAASKAIIGKAEELRLVTDGSGNPLCQIKSGGSWQSAATSSSSLPLNEWAHVVCSYDKSSLKVYVNGVRKASQSLSVGVDDTSYHMKLGADDSSGSSYADYQGYMDEVRIYPYARSATQIGFDYNIGFAGMSSQKGAAAALGNLSDKWMSDDLVGYWRMDESSWNGTNGEVRDSSGNTKHGTGFGGVTTAVGKFGKGGSFDGADDYVSSGDLGNNIRTISFWIKADTLTSRKIIDLDGTDQIELDGSGNITATSFPGTTTVYVDGGVSPALTEGWHHVAITDTEGVTGSAVNLGRVSSGYFDGALDEVRFYTRVLSPGEVDKLYRWEPKPILHIKMDEKVSGDARTLYDTSGNQRNATTEQGANEAGMDCTQRGKYGSGCDLDGTDDSIQINDFDY